MSEQTNNSDQVLIAYLENVRESRRIIENQENRLYDILVKQHIREGIAVPNRSYTNISPTNGLPTNGLPTNGLPTNGLPTNISNTNGLYIRSPTNGLPTNGLPTNGLSTNGLPTNGSQQVQRINIAQLLQSMLHLINPIDLNNETESFNDPVIVRPSAQTIGLATNNTLFGDITNPPNETCPITQSDFNPESIVTQIHYCGHVFCRDELAQWFNLSVRCPVCRYDIRNFTTLSSDSDDSIDSLDSEIESLDPQLQNLMSYFYGIR